jgi:long-chain fatty acid transport protein
MRLGFATALSLALMPITAHEAIASGFMVRENSAESVATSYAGDASRADEAATVFSNPAGMVRFGAPELEFGAAVVFPSIHISGSASAAGVIPIQGTQGGQAGQIAGIPDFYLVVPLSDQLFAGLAVTAPFGNTTNYKSMFVGRYQGIKTLALSADINPNIAWKVNDKVSIGGGISAQWLKIEQSAAIPQFLILGSPVPDGYFLFNGHGWALGYNAGVLLQPNDTTRLGFTYRSGVTHNISGSLDFTNTVIPLVSGPAKATGLDLPGTAAVSFTHDFTPQWSASAGLQYNQWSSFKQVIVTTSANPPLSEAEHYRDSWMFSVGGIYHLTNELALRAGTGWDESPVTTNFRTVGIPDGNRYMVGAGAGYTFAPGMNVDFGYTHYFATETTSVTGSVNSIDPFTGAIVLRGDFHNYLDYFALSFRFAL